ncbi:MAG: aldehyde dehydrogenase family protein, partial [Firmicutes bacterium]|nr:aldehyde dehydrogenase family protein [Bacillota bacterium]
MNWSKEEIHQSVEIQRKFFQSGKTLDVNWRIRQLKKLRNTVVHYEKQLEDALFEDLGRSEAEAYFCDIGTVILEINEIIEGLKKWARPELHFSGFTCFPSLLTKVYKMPYGVTLIISPFNFPILLSFGVLAASIAGGNTAVIKTSSKSKACTAMMQQMMADTFPPEYVTVIDGGHEVADLCLEERFDKIFYTGSPKVAKHVMAMAAQHLTPV